jgi:integrase/recombinase XerD
VPVGAKPVWWAVRLSTARSFARFLSALDPATEIPPAGLLPEPSHRAVPYIYSDEDIERLLRAAGRLNPEHRADTYQTLIALIAVTGMRVGEAVRLDRDDVNLDKGVITIRNSKFGKSRQVPLHPTSVEALGAYARRRDERRPVPKSTSFFASAIGTRVLRDNVCTVFPRLVREAGLRSPNRLRPPRAHDLRHTFAVRCVISWYRQGPDVERRMPLLSTWLGHVDPGSSRSATSSSSSGTPVKYQYVSPRPAPAPADAAMCWCAPTPPPAEHPQPNPDTAEGDRSPRPERPGAGGSSPTAGSTSATTPTPTGARRNGPDP